MDDQRAYRESCERVIDKIRATARGIFFVHAKWSAGSCWALKRFNECVERHGIPSGDVIYLDADDDEPALGCLPEFRNFCNGWAEVAVVRDGQVVYATNLGRERDEFISRWNHILSAYSSGK
jgi:hypothetical protein